MSALLAMLGVSSSTLRRLALALGAFALCVALGALWLRYHNRAVIERHDARIAAQAAEARETAASERARDAATNAVQEERYHAAIEDAVDRAGDDKPGDAALALNCERLRRLGRIPPACRLAGRNRGQAGSP